MGVAAAFEIAHQRQEPVHRSARGDEIVFQSRFEYRGVLARSARGSAADPGRGAPQEVIECLVVGAANHLVAVTIAQTELVDAAHVTGGFFDANHVWQVEQAVEHFVAHFRPGAPGEVVEDDREAHALGDGAIVGEQFALGGARIGRDGDHQGLIPDFFSGL